MKKAVLIAITLFCAISLFAQSTYYVSMTNGSNRNDGSKASPFKNLQKALDVAEAGSTIMVAQGVYYGLLERGYLKMKNPVKIIGGYSDNFSTRDVLKYATKLQPPVLSSNGNPIHGTAGNFGLLEITTKAKNVDILLDGLIFDRGEGNGYHPTDGKPAGFDMGILTHPPATGINGTHKGVRSIKMPLIRGQFDGNMTIQNCTFTNSAWYAISMSVQSGKLTVKNNVFVANTMSACEVWGALAKENANIEFAYNTVLFTWSRTKDLGDMGYGFRYMTKINAEVHHNIFGMSTFSALDRTRYDPNATATAEHNIFFLNKQADLVVPGGGMFMRVRCDMFDDVTELTKTVGNKELKDATQLKNVINKAYLEGFLSATYTESTDYDPNSPANQFRSAMGMNQVGAITSKVSMYANKYPLDDAIKLFGAIDGYGAQKNKIKIFIP